MKLNCFFRTVKRDGCVVEGCWVWQIEDGR